MNKKILLSALLIAVSATSVGCKRSNQIQNGASQSPVSEAKSTDSASNANAEDSNSNAVAADTATKAGQPQLKIKDITSQVTWGYRPANRGRNDIDIIVVHSNYHVVNQQKQIFDFNVDGCIKQFRDGGTAPHYMITRDGTILKMVDEKNVAYQAGKSALPDGSRTMLNTSSIGIEVISMKRNGPTEAQYRALDTLIKDICSRYDIQYLTRHSDIATPRGRKDDPWGMDWKRVVDNVKAKYPNITTYNIPVKNNPQFK